MPMIQGTSRFDWRRLFCLPPKRWHPPPQPPNSRARTTQDAVRMKQRREDKLRRLSENNMSLSQPADSVAADLTDTQIREAVQAVVGDRARLRSEGSRYQSSSGETTPTPGQRKQRKDSPPPLPPQEIYSASTRAGDPLPSVPMKPPIRHIWRQAVMPPVGEARSSEERDSVGSGGGGTSNGGASFADWRATDKQSQEEARRSQDARKEEDKQAKGRLDRSSFKAQTPPRTSLERVQRDDILASRQSSGEHSASSTGGTKPPPQGPRQLKRIQTTKPNAYAVLSENGALRNTIERMRSQLTDMRKQLEAAEQRAEKGKKARHNLMLYNNIVSAIEATPSNQEKMAGFYQLVSIKHTMIDKARGRIQNKEVVMPKEAGIYDTWPTLSPFAAPVIQQPTAQVPKRAAEDPGPSKPTQAPQVGSSPVPKTFEAAPPVAPGQPSEEKQRVAPVDYEVPALPDR